MPETYANDVATTLNGGITNSATTLIVASAVGFPSGPQFRIKIDNELLLVTAGGSGTTTWTVTRGVEGTAPASHASGAAVDHVFTSGAIDQIRQDICGGGTFAARPAVSKRGNLYFANDSQLISRDTGSAQEVWGPIWKLTPPILSEYSWINQGGATADDTHGGIMMKIPANSGDSLRMLVKDAPTPPYTVTIGLLSTVRQYTSGYQQHGIVFHDTVSGKAGNTGLNYENGNPRFDYNQFNSPTSFFTTPFRVPMTQNPAFNWFRLVDDGTNRKIQTTGDGFNWITYYSEARTYFITPNKIGFGGNITMTGADIYMTVLHFTVTTP